MIHVSIISGFLGAGKTTLIKKLIAEAFEGEKVILLENEYGEVGIDGGFMKDSGIEITELNSGCICCTLAGDFTEAIGEIVEKFNPDRLIIEPSGVGKLSDIRRVVEEQEKETGLVHFTGSATVVDAGKCRMYMKNFGEFFIDQVKCAETVIFSRTQLVSQEKLEKAFELVRELNAEARLISTPWDQITGSVIVDAIEHPAQLIDVNSVAPRHEHHHHHHHDHDEECCCHEHEHEHHHHHHHGCGCGHDHDHDADEVFDNIGIETVHKFDASVLENALKDMENEEKYGIVLRMKGIIESTDGSWIHFDYTPGEYELRKGSADYTGRLCIIGSGLNKDAILKAIGM